MKKRHIFIAVATVQVLLMTLVGCDADEASKDLPTSSFNLIQRKILNVSCAIGGCHASVQDVSFNEHKLVLNKEVAYQNIVNIDPENRHASEDGLKIVAPGDAENSLLIHKLHCHRDHHENDYGNLMPIGLNPLSSGQIEFISQWIDQGASADAVIEADTNLLNDNIPDCEENFTPLAPPGSGTGFQLKVEQFEVPPHFEREIFVYKDLGNEEPVFINKLAMKMRRNSHHFLVNSFSDQTPTALLPPLDIVRDLRDANNKLIGATLAQMEYQIFAMASQVPEMEYQFPPGVALKMPPHHKLDVNLHYVNKSTNTLAAECYINFYAADPDEVVYEAQPIFFSNEKFFLPARQKTIILKSFLTSVPMQIFMLTSHTHKLGERFEIQVVGGPRSGETIYASSNWHHPEVKTYDPPIALAAGEGLKMMVTFDNITDKPVAFGLTSENEMAIIYGYYY